MKQVGRALVRGWVSILLLCCGGCAFQPFLEASAKSSGAGTATTLVGTSSASASQANPGSPGTAPPTLATPTTQPKPVASLSDAVAVRDALRSQGRSDADAELFAQRWLATMESLSQSDKPFGAVQVASASDELDPDVIPLDPADGGDMSLSPADVHVSAARTNATPRPPESSRYSTESSAPRPRTPAATSRKNSRDSTEVRSDDTGVDQSQDASTASHDEPDTSDSPNIWLEPMREAADRLRSELDNPELSPEMRSKYEVMLSLLLLAEEDPERAVSALESFDDQELEFWRQTVLGLGVLLDTDTLPKRQHRVERATEFMRQGLDSLSTLGRLQVRNLALCTKINGFGDFVECRPAEIKAGAKLLLYVEVENYQAEPRTAGATQKNWLADSKRRAEPAAGATTYATEFHGHYEIYDANQDEVTSKPLLVARDECRNRRRDYFIPYEIVLPSELPPGAYRLDLTLEDKKSDKVGNASLDFQIR